MAGKGAVPYLNSKISLVSKSGVRYEGTLYSIDPQESTVALSNVRSFGTEDRQAEKKMPPSNEVYEYIIFKGSDIQELTVMERPPAAPSAPPSSFYNDPSMMGAQGYPSQQPYGMPPGYPGMMGGAYGQGYGYNPYAAYGQYMPQQWGPYGYPPQGQPAPFGRGQGLQRPGPPGQPQPGLAPGAPQQAPAPAQPKSQLPPSYQPQVHPSQPAAPASAPISAPAPVPAPAPTPVPHVPSEPQTAPTPVPAPVVTPSSSSPVPGGFDIKDKASEAARASLKAKDSSAGASAAPPKQASVPVPQAFALNTAPSSSSSASSQAQPAQRQPGKKPQQPANNKPQQPQQAHQAPPQQTGGGSRPPQKKAPLSWAQKVAAPGSDAAPQAQAQAPPPQAPQVEAPPSSSQPQQRGGPSQRGHSGRGGRGGRGGGRGGSHSGSHPVTAAQLKQSLKDDFDLEASNAAFDKNSLMQEIEAERLRLRETRGGDSEGLEASVEPGSAYNPSVSIFDTLSSSALGSEDQYDRNKERDLNTQTFGEAPSFHHHRGRGGRGGGRGGGGRPSHHNSNRNQDPNLRARQQPQQPPRSNKPAPRGRQ